MMIDNSENPPCITLRNETQYTNSLRDALARCYKLKIERLEKSVKYKLNEMLEKDTKSIESDFKKIGKEMMEIDMLEILYGFFIQSDDVDVLETLYDNITQSDDSD